MESGETSTEKLSLNSCITYRGTLGRHSTKKLNEHCRVNLGIDSDKTLKEKEDVNSIITFPENLAWNRVKMKRRS